MSKTQISSKQILNGSIRAEDMDITTSGNAVITKVAAGAGVKIESTGIDGGTGIVTISTGYKHTQDIPFTVWTITHNLNKFPNVVVSDGSGNELVGDVHFTNENVVIVSFSEAISGIAYLT